jgi:hypothetical protein
MSTKTTTYAFGADYHAGVDYADQMSLAELAAAGGKVTRVRVLADVWPGLGLIGDISYIHGTLPSGQVVPIRVDLPSGGMGVLVRELKGEFIAWGKEQGVFAKGIGLLDNSIWSVLR